MKKIIIILIFLAAVLPGKSQNVNAKSNVVSLNFSNGKTYNSSLPTISWRQPESEVSFTKEGRIAVNVSIESKHELTDVKLIVKEKDSNEPGRTLAIPPGVNGLQATLDRAINLVDGIHELEIIAENKDGLKASSKRTIHVGATVLADASKIKRTDYALIFVTDQYDNWNQLVNPVFDGRTIANELRTAFGFNTELIENPTQEEVFLKLRQYAERKYEQLDQLFIFFAGHGFYDELTKEGFLVTRQSLQVDPGRQTYIPHSRLQTLINNNPCEHIFLVMDVCFGGTFDESAASRNVEDQIYGEPSQSEIIIRKLQYKTRKYLTSGGKEYVSDGVAGKHSPFAKQFIEALQSRGGNDGILTLSELMTFVEKLKTAPQSGRFGADKLGSEFVFVVK